MSDLRAGRSLPAPRHRSVLLSKLYPLHADSSQQSIVEELRRVILSGDVPPGTVIPVSDVAQHFGVSHIPVREALKSLIAEQLIDHRHNFGYSVAKLTRAELTELYVVRGVLEAAALGAAVEMASAEDHAAAEQALLALDQANRLDDYRAYHRESRRFHFALIVPCRMQRLLSMLDSAWNLTEPYQPMAHIDPSVRLTLHAEHQEMLSAFTYRDADRLALLAARHQHDLEQSITTMPADDELFAAQPRRASDLGEPSAPPSAAIPR